MKSIPSKRLIAALFSVYASAILWTEPVRAEITDIAQAPIAQAPSAAVLPNLMYILDDSGSMMWDYMPDNVQTLTTGQRIYNCKSSDGSFIYLASSTPPQSQCALGNPGSSDWNTADWGEPPYYSAQFNQIYYNPDITYTPGTDYTGVSLGNQTATAAKKDAYLNPTTVDLTNNYPEVYYCNNPSPAPTDLTNTSVCRRNGIDNVAPSPLAPGAPSYFLYWSNNTPGANPLGAYPSITTPGSPTPTDFVYQIVTNPSWAPNYVTGSGHPYYFKITPNEYCSDTNLVNCGVIALANGNSPDPVNFPYPALVRYCATIGSGTPGDRGAADPNPVSGTANPNCRKKFDVSTYPYPRYGRFQRTDIVPGTPTYPKSASSLRSDCASPTVCTYAEELQNFANWYSYYRVRMAMMKTATGRAFLQIDDRYRVGFLTINPGGPVLSSRYLPISQFNVTQKSNWYTMLYQQSSHGGTPLRQALSRAGRHYAGVTTGINSGMPLDPVQYSCQQNFSLLTTDGYYNDFASSTQDVGGIAVGDQDNVPGVVAPIFVSRDTGTLDASGSSGTVVQTSTPSQFVSQVVCTGNGSTSFPDGTQTTCGCTGNQQQVIQRTSQGQVVVSTVGGVQQGGPSNVYTSDAFSTITACVANGTAKTTLSPNPTITSTGPATSTTVSSGGTPNTLADVAMYYYKNDLRPALTPKNVPTTAKDVAPFQHMVTFTLGMGLNGFMDYRSDYETNPVGDFANIKAGTPGACGWTAAGAQCNWPVPVAATPSALDDLWHAAVNGRGVYYSASDPNSLANGLSSALAALKIATGAAAASATSSPNITQTNNFIYSSTFRTSKWDGEVVAQQIDTASGTVLPAIVWSAQSKLDATTSASADSRTIYTFSSSGLNKLKSFAFAGLTGGAGACSLTAEQACFQAQGPNLPQWSTLTGAQQTTANDGNKMVNYLRGQRGNEQTATCVPATSTDCQAFRVRDHILGDPVNGIPVFVAAPTFSFTDAPAGSYNSFKSANANRSPTLYVAANDGMLHAFDATGSSLGGGERWAYVPHPVFKQPGAGSYTLAQLASSTWATNHKYSVDGSPTVMDVYDSTATAWKTILVAGLNSGGRGFYALDITNPNNPIGLWEICSDSALCAIGDPDIGLSFGNPVITKRASDGRWVALLTSGLNNATPGTGQGYLFVVDAMTGQILQKIQMIDGATTWGDTTTPSGFAKISAFANAFNSNNTATFVYGGDLFGNVWRVDMSVAPVLYPTVQTTGVQKLAQLVDATGKPQSITTRPELGVIQGNRVLFIGTGRYIGTSDLPDPSTLSPAEQWAYQQSIYAFKDKGVNYGNVRTATPGLVQQTLTDSLGTRTISSNPVDWTVKDGWFVDLNPANTSPGERVNLDPQLVLGTLVVVSNVPNNSACTVGGDSFFYQFNYASGSYVVTSPGNVAGTRQSGQITVGIVIVRLPSGVFKGIATGATGTKTPVGVNIGGGGGGARRVNWREVLSQ